MSTGSIVGIVIGALAAVVLIFAGLYFARLRWSKLLLYS